MAIRSRALAVGAAAALALTLAPMASAGVPVGSPANQVVTQPRPLTLTPQANQALLSAPELGVLVSKEFPQIVSYEWQGSQIAGRTAPLTSITLNGNAHAATVADFSATDSEARYLLSVPDVGVELTVVITAQVRDSVDVGRKAPVIRFEITDVADQFSGKEGATLTVNTIAIPNHSLVSVSSNDAEAMLSTARVGVNRQERGDRHTAITASTAVNRPSGAAYAFLSHSKLAAALETNGVFDLPGGAAHMDNNRWITRIEADGNVKVASVEVGNWTWRSDAEAHGLRAGYGAEPNPYVEVTLAGDVNASGKVDWQDGAVAFADIDRVAVGYENTKNYVTTRIPFNFSSQATHPFLQTADSIKRVALATDNLGQRLLLKGYGSEGHDSAHPDYGDNFNHRAGGLKELRELATIAEQYNSMLGVHVNTTEMYTEAYNFGTTPVTNNYQAKGWDWLGASYYMDQRTDLGTGNVTDRFQELWDAMADYPAFRWVYIDVYYNFGWQANRLAHELNKMGFEVASEWADKFEAYNTWSHWANDENYGGTGNKGINSGIIRFIDNHHKDTFNPDATLGAAEVKEFEGWTGHQNYNEFYRSIWRNQLPTKFLQQSRIIQQERDRQGYDIYTFANGTVARGKNSVDPVISAPTAQNDAEATRTIDFDGARVYDHGRYLIPWSDGGTDRLYYYNPAGSEATFTLTDAWKGQSSLTLFRLTQQGRVKISDLAVSGGTVTIPASAYDGAEKDAQLTAFVLYPTSAVPAVTPVVWGEGTGLKDPSFMAGELGDNWAARGDVKVVSNRHWNYMAQLGEGAASMSQRVHLDEGDYVAQAQIEIQPGRRREVAFSATGTGVTPLVGKQQGAADVSGATPDNPVTIYEQDFENVENGWAPFSKGSAGSITDPRTVLVERNDPWTAQGGILENKVDSVLDGQWSLRSHKENRGLVYRTTEQSLKFLAGHRYRVSFDYQSDNSGGYIWVTGYNKPAEPQPREVITSRVPINEQLTTARFEEEFTAGGCGEYFVGLLREAGGADFVMDNFRVEDLGKADEQPACASLNVRAAKAAIPEGETVQVTVSLTNDEAVAISNVELGLEVDTAAGWTVTPSTAQTTASVPVEGVARATFTVTAPADGAGSTGIFTGTVKYTVPGDGTRVASAQTSVAVMGAIKDGVNYLSNLMFAETPQNGWGPVERDQSNGEQAENDGLPIKMAGKLYEKGLGAHAESLIKFELGGKCQILRVVVGIQDGQPGDVLWSIRGDGTELQGGHAKGGQQPTTVAVSVKDVSMLELYADPNGSNGNDHINWADAKVECDLSGGGPGPTPDPEYEVYDGTLTVASAPEAELGYSPGWPAANMVDNNPSTFYDTKWTGVPFPGEIMIDLNTSQQVTLAGIRYTPPNRTNPNGRIKDYEVWMCQDGANCDRKVAEGTLVSTASPSDIVFSEPADGKFFLLKVLTNYAGTPETNNGLVGPENGLIVVAEIDALVPKRATPDTSSVNEPAAPAPELVTPDLDDYAIPMPMSLPDRADGEVRTVLHSSMLYNTMASDERNRSYFQKVPVYFHVPAGGADVTLSFMAADGSSRVLIDDVRLQSLPIAYGDRPPARTIPAAGHVVFDNEALTYTILPETGVQYSVAGEVVEPGTYDATDGQTITVTAAATGAPYVYDAGESDTFKHTFGDQPAPTEVTPVAPTFDDKEGTGADVVTITAVEGVKYLINGVEAVAGDNVLPAGTTEVTVTAEALDGYVLKAGAPASWSHTFDATVTPDPEPTPVEDPCVAAGNCLFFLVNDWSSTKADVTFRFGSGRYDALVGDWNGDGVDTVVLRNGNKYYFRYSNTTGKADKEFTFGKAGDEVYVGDWDGDGVDTLVVRRGNRFFVKNAIAGGNADYSFDYGKAGDEVLVGDWNASGTDTLGVRRGNEFFLRNSTTTGIADVTFHYGRAGDEVLVGDWDGDGKDTFTVRRGNQYFMSNSHADGPADTVLSYGKASDIVLVGDWDKDGKDTLGVYRQTKSRLNGALLG